MFLSDINDTFVEFLSFMDDNYTRIQHISCQNNHYFAKIMRAEGPVVSTAQGTMVSGGLKAQWFQQPRAQWCRAG